MKSNEYILYVLSMYIHIMIFETEYLHTLHILHTLIIYMCIDRIAHAVDTIPSAYIHKFLVLFLRSVLVEILFSLI